MTRALVFVFMISVASSSHAKDAVVPQLKQTKEIAVYSAGSGWIMHFHADGSGSFQFGSLVGDGGGFPKSTVDFSALYQEIAQTLVPMDRDSTNRGKQVTAVTFKTTEGYTKVHTRNADAIAKAFKKGMNAIEDPYLAHRLEYLRWWSNPFGEKDGANHLWDKAANREELKKTLAALIEKRVDEHDRIQVLTRAGWKLTINTDGSGELSIGRHAALTATFGANTVDFARAYSQLVREPVRTAEQVLEGKTRFPESGEWVVIRLKEKSDSMRTIPVAKVDRVAIMQFFERAWNASTRPNKSLSLGESRIFLSMDQAWKHNPPVHPQVISK